MIRVYVTVGRWAVENQIGKKNLVIDDCDARQSVYVFGCKDSLLQIQGTLCPLKCLLSYYHLNS